MRAATTLALVAALAGGCATTWGVTQASGLQRSWDEDVHTAAVPVPGVEERLTVALPLVITYDPLPGASAGTTPSATSGTPRRFALACESSQRGHETRYQNAYRYGHSWKRMTAIAFLIEGLTGAALLYAGSQGHDADTVYGAYFALDAAVTGALFFLPKQEVFHRDDVAVDTHLRSDCPAGLTLDLGGASFPVDAAGRIGDVGEAALVDWMAAPQGVVQLSYGGRAVELPLGVAEQCAWRRSRQPITPTGCPSTSVPSEAVATLRVPTGTLIQLDTSR